VTRRGGAGRAAALAGLPALVAAGLLLGAAGPAGRPGAEVPVYPGLAGAPLPPESYGIARVHREALHMDALHAVLADWGRRRGADAVVLLGFDQSTSTWNATHTPSDVEGHVVGRAESVEVAQATARADAAAMRAPLRCIGATIECTETPGEGGGASGSRGEFGGGDGASAPCVPRVTRLVAGGPAEASGLVVGNVVEEAAGRAVRHPWDVYRRADSAGKRLRVQVATPDGTRVLAVSTRSCEEIYPIQGVRAPR
jgi:hypothetical protein